MRDPHVTFPGLALIAGTRARLGAGMGLPLADRLSEDGRKAAGWTLLLVGAVTTIPLALAVFGASRSAGRIGREDLGRPASPMYAR